MDRPEHAVAKSAANDSTRRQPLFIIIGAGMAGILSAIKPREAGYDDFVVYSSSATDFKSIEIVDVDGSDRVPVLDDGFEYLSPCFSPDGEQIYFLSNRDVASNELYVVNGG